MPVYRSNPTDAVCLSNPTDTSLSVQPHGHQSIYLQSPSTLSSMRFGMPLSRTPYNLMTKPSSIIASCTPLPAFHNHVSEHVLWNATFQNTVLQSYDQAIKHLRKLHSSACTPQTLYQACASECHPLEHVLTIL